MMQYVFFTVLFLLLGGKTFAGDNDLRFIGPIKFPIQIDTQILHVNGPELERYQQLHHLYLPLNSNGQPDPDSILSVAFKNLGNPTKSETFEVLTYQHLAPVRGQLMMTESDRDDVVLSFILDADQSRYVDKDSVKTDSGISIASRSYIDTYLPHVSERTVDLRRERQKGALQDLVGREFSGPQKAEARRKLNLAFGELEKLNLLTAAFNELIEQGKLPNKENRSKFVREIGDKISETTTAFQHVMESRIERPIVGKEFAATYGKILTDLFSKTFDYPAASQTRRIFEGILKERLQEAKTLAGQTFFDRMALAFKGEIRFQHVFVGGLLSTLYQGRFDAAAVMALMAGVVEWYNIREGARAKKDAAIFSAMLSGNKLEACRLKVASKSSQ